MELLILIAILVVFVSVVVVLAAFFWSKQGNDEETRRRAAAQKLGFDSSFLQKPKPLNEVDAALISYMNQHLAMLNVVASKLPPIPAGDKAMASMSRKEREKLGFVLGPEVARGIGQLTADKMEIMVKLQEAGHRLAHWIQVVGMESVALPAGLDAELAIAQQLMQLAAQADEKFGDNLDWAIIADALKGKVAARLINESKLAGGMVNANDMAKIFIAARAQRLAAQGKTPQPINLELVDHRNDDETLALDAMLEDLFLHAPLTGGN